jgi:hypothetical protein
LISFWAIAKIANCKFQYSGHFEHIQGVFETSLKLQSDYPQVSFQIEGSFAALYDFNQTISLENLSFLALTDD